MNTTIHPPQPTGYAIPHPTKHTSIGKRAAFAAIGTISAAAVLGAAAAYTGSVAAQVVTAPAPVVAIAATDGVANPSAATAPDDTIQPVTAPGSITATSCPSIPPTRPGHLPVDYHTCAYPKPHQGGGGLTGVDGPGGGGVSTDPSLGNDPDPLPPTGGGGGGANSCTNLDKTCHATQ